MKKIALYSIVALLSFGMIFTSCEAVKNTNNTQRGAGIGAVAGAVLGGVLGNNLGKGGNGALGSVLGGVFGGVNFDEALAGIAFVGLGSFGGDGFELHLLGAGRRGAELRNAEGG